MTRTQSIIINLIREGYRNTEIVQHTQKSPEYVSRIRCQLKEDPHYFETRAVINRIENAKPKPKDYSGPAECLRCECTFHSPDRRRIRICDDCKGHDTYMMEPVTEHRVFTEELREELRGKERLIC